MHKNVLAQKFKAFPSSRVPLHKPYGAFEDAIYNKLTNQLLRFSGIQEQCLAPSYACPAFKLR